ncbi:MAG: glycosyl hydrolase [Pirellulaceae bacterium]
MFSESDWSRKSIGDVDVVFHEGLYHLFYLVLPNHDFIAHAISENAINWRRVDNAVFIGDPGSWDDLMLWTMHITPDPHVPGGWRMFYTGLSRRDQGKVQRVGMARSDDLYHWQKGPVHWSDTRGQTDPEIIQKAQAKLSSQISDRIKSTRDTESSFPLEADAEFYEASLDTVRDWVSFRDPFYYREGDRGWLAISGRVNHGPMVRRGCVALYEESSPDHFSPLPPLHAPMLYDDIEVPNIFRIDGEYYLIGSLREDAKIRYWHTTKIEEPWKNYYDNVVLAKGNYAGRVCPDEQGFLLWNFFTQDLNDRTANNLLLPPKRLMRRSNGQLQVTSFEGIERRAIGPFKTKCLQPLKGDCRDDSCPVTDGSLRVASEAGFQGFVFEDQVDCFSMRCRLSMTGIGKCGILCRIDPESHDGYYISLDLLKGIAQIRVWGTAPGKSGEDMMMFRSLQEDFWRATNLENLEIHLLAFGSYLELSLQGSVLLSLADSTFDHGLLGFYVETAELEIHNLDIQRLEPPTQSDEHLANG